MTTTYSTDTTYVEIPAGEVPAGVIWDTPRRHQGQTVEVSYATRIRSTRGGADDGDEYKRVIDRSVPETRYYRLVTRGEQAATLAEETTR